MGRFTSVAIPHFLCLAILIGPRPVVRTLVVAASIAIQVLLARGAVAWYFVG
jgi:hypothetical protein